MNRISRLVCLVMVPLVMLALAACNAPVKGAANQGRIEQVKMVATEVDGNEDEIKFWMTSSDPAMPKYVEEVKGDIKVEFTAVPHNEYERRLRLAIAGGQAPDIIGLDGPNMPSYAESGCIIPLDDFWNRSDLEDFPESVIKSVQYKGKIYAMPIQETGTVLFYNKKIFAEAGIEPPTSIDNAWTFEEYYKYANKVTEKDVHGKTIVYGTQPCMDPPSAIHEGMTYNYLMYISAAGGRAVSEDSKTATGYFDGDSVKKAMKLIADLHRDGIAPEQIIPNGFQTGKIASVVTGLWMIGEFNNCEGLEWGTTPMARDVTYGAGMGSWEIAITSQSRNKEMSWKFVERLGSKQNVGKYCEAINNLPVRKSVTVSFIDKEPYKTVKEGFTKYGVPRPAFKNYPQVSELINQAFNAVAFGEDINTVVTKYTEEINKVLSH